MTSKNDHVICVDDWMERTAKDLPSEQLLEVFELTFTALWRRAHQTLGDVTLTAIAVRVLQSAAEEFPELSALALDAGGLRCKTLGERAGGLNEERLAAELRFLLVEFLMVLGSLTADVITPALHSELSKIAPKPSS